MVCFSPVFFSGFICVRVFMSNSHSQYINELKEKNCADKPSFCCTLM